MRKEATFAISLVFAGATAIALAQVPEPQKAPGQPGRGRLGASVGGQQPMPPSPNPNSQYRLGPDSMSQEGVPKGEIHGPYTLPSNVYPGTQHTYWVYVPAQYDSMVPAAMMVYQDGQALDRKSVV